MMWQATLSRQLFIRLGGFSLLLLVLTACLNAWVSADDEEARQLAEVNSAVAAYGAGLGKAAWELDDEALRLQLGGLRHFPAVLFAEVEGTGVRVQYRKAGADPGKAGETMSFPLLAPGTEEVIARLHVQLDSATLRNLVGRQTLQFVVAVGMELLLLALLIFWLIRRSVSDPVLAISRHVSQLGVDRLDRPAPMPTAGERNELHQLAEGITRLQGELRDQLAHRDATATQLAAQRDQLNAMLDRERRQLDDVLHNMADGAGVIDGRGIVQFANPAWRAMLGIGNADDVSGWGPDRWLAAPTWNELALRIAAEGSLIAHAISLRAARDGGELPVEASFSMIERGADDAPARIQIVLRDVTARIETERNLIAAREAALQTARAKSDFLANMSHEIRTPMNAIIGMTDLALRTELTPRQQKFLDTARLAAQSLLGIINDILDFSKIEAGKVELEREPFAIEQTLQEVASVIGLQAGRKGLELVIDTADDVPRSLLGDERRVRQVLVNLCNNAVKFTSAGEIMVTTRRVPSSDPDRVRLRIVVRDTGIGIAPEQMDRLFKPFSQVDASTTRKFGGTGLGLAISRQLLNLMGGDIEVDSEPGKGSEFRFELSFDLDPTRPTIDDTAAGEAPLHLLVVDDNASVRHIALRLLMRLGCAATVVDSAGAALEQLTRPGAEAFDLVLMDWNMPDIDGFEATRRIRAMTSLPRQPRIVLMTAFGDDDTRQRATREGLDGYLTKPLSLGVLREMLAIMRRKIGEHAPGQRPAKSDLDRLRTQVAGLHVLLVEDNVFNQELAQELLLQAGILTTLAENGEEALTHVELAEFDAVLMDIQMPVMDGLEATRHIRRRPALSGLPIIAMTAHALPEDRERCLVAGMNDCVTKPFSEAELLDVLCQWTHRLRNPAPTA